MRKDCETIKLSGQLTPCFKKWPGNLRANYKVQADDGFFYLILNPDQEIYADTIVWDQVEIVGALDKESYTVRVKRINGNVISEGDFDSFNDFSLGKEELERKLRKLGKIELDTDLIAS